MAKIKFCIAHNENEWLLIEQAIQEIYRNKPLVKGKGFSNFMASEIRHVFKSVDIEQADPGPLNRIKKNFEISVSDEDYSKISFMCKRLSITPAVLLSRLIIQPRLTPHILKITAPKHP